MEQPKKFAFKAKPTTLVSGATYEPVEVKDGKAAVHALLAMTLAHTAEVFHGILDAVADQYKIDKEQMMDVVLAHPAYTSIRTSEILNSLGYFDRPATTPPAPEAPVAAPAAAPKKKFKVKKPAAE